MTTIETEQSASIPTDCLSKVLALFNKARGAFVYDEPEQQESVNAMITKEMYKFKEQFPDGVYKLRNGDSIKISHLFTDHSQLRLIGLLKEPYISNKDVYNAVSIIQPWHNTPWHVKLFFIDVEKNKPVFVTFDN